MRTFSSFPRLPAAFAALMGASCLGMIASPAMSCMMAPPPFDPAFTPSDAIVVAQIVGEDAVRKGWPSIFRLKPIRQVYGAGAPDVVKIGGVPPCPSDMGPAFSTSDRLLLYLRQDQRGGYFLLGWRIAGTESDFSSVLETNRVAERRELRRTQYYPVNRSWRYGRTVALSANDPNAWFRDDDFPPGFFDPPNNDRLMVVAFDVTKDGNMGNCFVDQPSGFADFDAKVCALIEERAKLVAPLFPEERSGRYTISRERRPSERLHR